MKGRNRARPPRPARVLGPKVTRLSRSASFQDTKSVGGTFPCTAWLRSAQSAATRTAAAAARLSGPRRGKSGWLEPLASLPACLRSSPASNPLKCLPRFREARSEGQRPSAAQGDERRLQAKPAPVATHQCGGAGGELDAGEHGCC